MQYIDFTDVFGKTFRVSKFIHGAPFAPTGRGIDGAFELMDRYRALGGNTFDVARFYGYPRIGYRESILADYIKDRDCRDDVVIITKGGMPELNDDYTFKRLRINRNAILGDFYTSCDQLQVEKIDMYLLHRDDPSVPVGEIMDILQEIVDTGCVRTIGVSNWSVERIQEANAYAAAHGRTPLVSSEIQWSYTYLNHKMRADDSVVIMNPEVYKQYEAYPIPVLAYSSQSAGLFSYLYTGRETWDTLKPARKMYDCPQNRAKVEKVQQYCSKHGVSPAALILAYLACNRVTCAPIFSCKTMEQMEDTMTGAELTLTQDVIDWLNE